MTSLVDTNVLVYRVDPTDPSKQRIAERLLAKGLRDDVLVLPHQAILEFVAATTRPRSDLDGFSLLTLETALREAEDLKRQFPVAYPDEAVLETAIRGVSSYHLSWWDAHLWAYAEVFGHEELLSEDFEHGRHYGSVRAVNPFQAAAGDVAELPALYGAESARRL